MMLARAALRRSAHHRHPSRSLSAASRIPGDAPSPSPANAQLYRMEEQAALDQLRGEMQIKLCPAAPSPMRPCHPLPPATRPQRPFFVLSDTTVKSIGRA